MSGQKGKLGRPTKKTPELVTKLLQVLGLGVHRKVAAAACGIAESTLHAWLAEDEELAAACDRVENAVEAKLVALLKKAALGGDTKAACWYLERRYPDRWGRRTANEAQTGSDGSGGTDALMAGIASWDDVLEAARKPRPRAPSSDDDKDN